MGPIRNPRWEQKRTEGYVIVSSETPVLFFRLWCLTPLSTVVQLYHGNNSLLTLPLFAGVSRVRALSPAWTGSHARETLISRTHLFLPDDLPQQKNQVQ